MAPAPVQDTPPQDPRRDLPAFGSLPPVADLGGGITRVLAPNPSHMTLDGTNTYVVGEPGSGAVAVVDPGPQDAAHLHRILAVVADRDAEVAAVVLTHHHHDHAEAAHPLADRLGCRVLASSPGLATTANPLGDDDPVDLGGLAARVVATPGHTADHLAFRLPDGSLLVGDHVLGRGTSVVVAPDGDLTAYLASLRRVLALGPDRLLPGHGPQLDEDPTAVVTYYLAHRAHRRQQVLDVLAGGPATARDVVEVVYADVDRQLWPAAEASTLATLVALRDEELVTEEEDTWSLTR